MGMEFKMQYTLWNFNLRTDVEYQSTGLCSQILELPFAVPLREREGSVPARE